MSVLVLAEFELELTFDEEPFKPKESVPMPIPILPPIPSKLVEGKLEETDPDELPFETG